MWSGTSSCVSTKSATNTFARSTRATFAPRRGLSRTGGRRCIARQVVHICFHCLPINTYQGHTQTTTTTAQRRRAHLALRLTQLSLVRASRSVTQRLRSASALLTSAEFALLLAAPQPLLVPPEASPKPKLLPPPPPPPHPPTCTCEPPQQPAKHMYQN